MGSRLPGDPSGDRRYFAQGNRSRGLYGHAEWLHLLGQGRQSLRRAIIWADVRAAKQADEFAAAYGGVEACHQRTGKRPSASFSLAKFMWVRENEPEIYAKTACILQTKDYIVYRLTGGSPRIIPTLPAHRLTILPTAAGPRT